jgi:hypothetical protein
MMRRFLFLLLISFSLLPKLVARYHLGPVSFSQRPSKITITVTHRKKRLIFLVKGNPNEEGTPLSLRQFLKTIYPALPGTQKRWYARDLEWRGDVTSLTTKNRHELWRALLSDIFFKSVPSQKLVPENLPSFILEKFGKPGEADLIFGLWDTEKNRTDGGMRRQGFLASPLDVGAYAPNLLILVLRSGHITVNQAEKGKSEMVPLSFILSLRNKSMGCKSFNLVWGRFLVEAGANDLQPPTGPANKRLNYLTRLLRGEKADLAERFVFEQDGWFLKTFPKTNHFTFGRKKLCKQQNVLSLFDACLLTASLKKVDGSFEAPLFFIKERLFGIWNKPNKGVLLRLESHITKRKFGTPFKNKGMMITLREPATCIKASEPSTHENSRGSP